MKKMTTQPHNNPYFIRQVSGGLNGAVQGQPVVKDADVLCNCVGFANGEFNRIINDPDLKGIRKPFKYQLVCNAENFIESARRQGLKISSVPTLGGIMVWQKGNTLDSWDGAGHVEVVEQINKDGSVVCSSSGWNGWAFRLLRRTNANGNWGQDSPYHFRGCIINPSVKDGEKVTEQPLVIDGGGGGLTVMALQKFLHKFEDGVISGQYANQIKYRRSLTAVENGGGGSSTVSALQKWLGITADGYWGKDTSLALQKRLVAEGYSVGSDGCDSYFGKDSMKALQQFLNWKLWGVNPPQPQPKPKKGYRFIDVSSWQNKINWKKVKASGIVGVIVRYADDDVIDTYFDYNMKGAIEVGLHVGAYIYSRARSKAEAERDAVNLYNACKPYMDKIDMPLYIDLEQKGLEKYADTVAIAFLNKMSALGVKKRGVYANLNWWNNYLTKTRKDYRSNSFWVAQYYDKCEFKPSEDVGIWQYSSKGQVDGITADWVDMDICYIPYWERKEPSLDEKIMDACKTQAEWMKNYTYGWENNPTIAKSKKKGTCVTYVACVLQRLGYLKSGEAIWHDGKGHVDDPYPNKMTVSYPKGTIKANKSKLKKGDVVLAGDPKSVEAGGNSHIFILTGKWDASGNPYIWDNNSATRIRNGKDGVHTYGGGNSIIGVVRLKG